jgi:hypothetical protein
MEAIMAATAPVTQYRDELIAGFEQRQSLLRSATTTEAVIKGNTATFLVADSGSASAVTRGVNGLIPARNDSLTQTSATLQEWHDLVHKTRFNIFQSQGNQRAIMQQTTMGVLNRKIDSDIIAALATGTLNTGTAVTADVNLVMRSLTILGNNDVPFDGGIFAVITPAFYAYLMQATEFASADYVGGKPYESGIPLQKPMLIWWNNVYWIVHPNLTGAGTSSETCFMFHRTAIGHAFDTDALDIALGYNEEQDYSFARATSFMGSKLLQNSGVVLMYHDGSAYVSA